MWGQPTPSLGARRHEAHGALDRVYDSIQRKTATLEEKRRKQGEVFLKIQQRRRQVVVAMHAVKRAREDLEEEQRWLEDALKSRWYEEANEFSGRQGAPETKRVLINVGGQLFETTARVLRRDPDSALAQLADRPPPDEDACPDGAWFFERDWWTFRFVLQWLREGEASLPRSKPLLKALYAEARYFGMAGLRASVRRVYQRIAGAEAEAEAPGVIGPAHARLRAEAEALAEEDTLRAGRAGAGAGAGHAAGGGGNGRQGWSLDPALSGAFAATPAGAMEELLRGRHGPAFGAPLSVVSEAAGRY